MNQLKLILIIIFLSQVSCVVEEDGNFSGQKINKLKEKVESLERKEIAALEKRIESLEHKLKNSKMSNVETTATKEAVLKKDPNQAIYKISVNSNKHYLNDPFMGDKDAKVLVMAFSDFQSKTCAKYINETWPLLKKEFIDSKKIKYIHRDFPLDQNQASKFAASFAQCSGEQGQYWNAHDVLYQNHDLIEKLDIEELINKVGALKPKKLKSCLKSKRYADEIELDKSDAIRMGAKGAPGFFVGEILNNDGNELFSGVFIRGAQPYPVIRQEILKLFPTEGI